MGTGSKPLLTSTGLESSAYTKSRCSANKIIIVAISFLAILAIILVLTLAIDWSSDTSTSRNNKYWQTQFLSLPSNESCKQISIDLASKPHVAGYPQQIVTGDYVTQLFENANIATMKQEWTNTVLDRFISSELRMSYNDSAWVTLNISEEIIAEDPDTNTSFRSHIWNAYSANGSVTGSVVYINYGRRSDYQQLIDNDNYTTITSNISFAGKIGLVRYGNMGRAIKVKIAQQYGIIGLLMFSDPAQYAPDPDMVYPYGPWLPPSGVQRGTVKFASCPGNLDMTRMQSLCGINSMEEAIPSIPVMPLSYRNAEILFNYMTDAVSAPNAWYGGINVDYKVDSYDLMINLNVETDLRVDDLTQNVYGIIEGQEFADQIVMIGAHRDSWVYGAQDDVSGSATILEVAKGFGMLYERGWRPRRTVIFASWDSEESGLIGSTNMGEMMRINDDLVLNDSLIAYINLDMTTGGDTFDISGHPLLRKVSEEAMRFTPIRNQRLSQFDTFYDKYMSESSQWGILGQGSDHTVFAYYLGISAMDLGFGGDTGGGAYHSVYDTIGWQETVDANWMLAEDIARYTGILVMKLLDSKVIPFDLEIFAATIKEWFVANLMAAMVDFECDPNDFIPDRNVTNDLLETLNEFETSAVRMNDIIAAVANRTDSGDVSEEDGKLVDEYNDLLGVISKQFIYAGGLPERVWHKNILWNIAIEDGPSNVFPYIWFALQYECNENMLRESFSITQNIINEATEMLLDYLGNA